MKISLPAIALLFLFGSTGCTAVVDDTAKNLGYERIKPAKQSENIHYYVSQLAQQLLLTSQVVVLDKSVAIGTILPVEQLNGKRISSVNPIDNKVQDSFLTINPIGHQIQESLMTLMSQAGLKVVEFKMSKNIKVTDNRDMMLSRKLKELNNPVKADYYLTGTFSEQDLDFAVNVRLIDIASQQVIAAATDFIPRDVMWQRQNTLLKRNLIYRNNP